MPWLGRGDRGHEAQSPPPFIRKENQSPLQLGSSGQSVRSGGAWSCREPTLLWQLPLGPWGRRTSSLWLAALPVSSENRCLRLSPQIPLRCTALSGSQVTAWTSVPSAGTLGLAGEESSSSQAGAGGQCPPASPRPENATAQVRSGGRPSQRPQAGCHLLRTTWTPHSTQSLPAPQMPLGGERGEVPGVGWCQGSRGWLCQGNKGRRSLSWAVTADSGPVVESASSPCRRRAEEAAGHGAAQPPGARARVSVAACCYKARWPVSFPPGFDLQDEGGLGRWLQVYAPSPGWQGLRKLL